MPPNLLSRFTLTLAIPILFAGSNAARAQDAGDKPLASYHDKNRVLLVFAPTAKDPAYQEQLKLWQSEKAGFDERQLVVVPVLADAKKPAADPPGTLAKKFGVDGKNFVVVLLGKDGHDAYRSTRPIPVATLYGAIDAMPMRRLEMKHPSPSPTGTPRPTPARPDLDHDE